MFVFMILLIGCGFLVGVLIELYRAIRDRHKQGAGKRVLRIIGAVLLIYGAFGFFGAGLSATGGLKWIPANSEFPMGIVDGAVSDGTLIFCPSTSWGRIQVYDREKKFIRGWFVNAFGGTFRINLDPMNNLQVATARQQMLYVFSAEGKLLSSSTYQPRTYSDFDTWTGDAVSIPTPFHLLPFTHPFVAWGIAFIGMVALIITNPKWKRRSPNKSLKPTNPATGNR
jgi:hypothetical protein